MTTPRTRKAVEQEIRETLGLVPSFFDRIPDEVLDQEWTLFKHWELEETLIPNKEILSNVVDEKLRRILLLIG